MPHNSIHPSPLSLQTAPALHKPAGPVPSGRGSLPVHFPPSILNHTPCPLQTRFCSSGKCRQNLCLLQLLPILPCRPSVALSLEEHLALLQRVLLANPGFTGVAHGSLCHAIARVFASLQNSHSSWAEPEQAAQSTCDGSHSHTG